MEASLRNDDTATSTQLPFTIYRTHIEDCHLPENAFTLDFMSDYLTMMDVLSKSMSRELDSACSLTPLQYRILIKLSSGKPVRAKDLSDELEVRASTISTAISKMFDRNLIDRSEDAKDMRVIGLAISAEGKRVLEIADMAMDQLVSEYWSSLTREQLEAAMRSSISAVELHSSPRFENGTQRLDTALLETVMISRSLTAHCLQSVGLAINDYRVLLALKIMGNDCSGADIAKFLFLNSCDITSSLKNLDAMRYITRERSSSNRRIRQVSLTASGEECIIELLPAVFDSLLETCHSNDELIRIHISSARDLVARKRHRSEF